jgi:hypothetical protein
MVFIILGSVGLIMAIGALIALFITSEYDRGEDE